MKGTIAGLLVVSSLLAAGPVFAQETTPGPGKLEVSIIPGGFTWFQKKDASPEFGNFDIGGAAAWNFTRVVGAEAEVAGSFGYRQDLNEVFGREKTPNMLSYTGNVVANLPGHRVVPYATGGIGGLTVYNRELLGVFDTQTHLTGNVGGGVKWFAPNGRWGLRGDYRFQAIRKKDDASEFFGRETQYGNRVYGAVIINAIK
jgi:hypothetical protein